MYPSRKYGGSAQRRRIECPWFEPLLISPLWKYFFAHNDSHPGVISEAIFYWHHRNDFLLWSIKFGYLVRGQVAWHKCQFGSVDSERAQQTTLIDLLSDYEPEWKWLIDIIIYGVDTLFGKTCRNPVFSTFFSTLPIFPLKFLLENKNICSWALWQCSNYYDR
jgi:hypothetical protein